MRHILFISAFILLINTANGQSGTYQDTSKTKNCYDDYYEAFSTRGAIPVADGEHNVVFTLRTDTSCVCVE